MADRKPRENPNRPTKDPHADCPTVEEYELRRRDRIAQAPKR